MNPLDDQPIEHGDEPPPPPAKPRSKLVLRIVRSAGLIALFLVAAMLGTVGGVLFASSDDIPEISALDNYQPNTITRLLARDERVIGEFAIERRIVIGYEDMAPVLRQAIIASEDGDFEQHFGLSVSRIIITAVKDIVYGQRFGASTITQQLARGLFLDEYMINGVFVRSGWPLVERKLKEMLVSVQLERRYTKAEILTLYANQMYLGHGAYGVEAASRMYFDKSAKDLTLEEAATIAAIIQTPARLSPFVNPERTLSRRNNYVLPRMADEGFITREEAAEAATRPLVLLGQPTPDRSIAPYFVEDIRKVLEQKFGADALYQTGLRVQTTLDVDLQEAANAAIDRGLRVVDKRRNGFRRPARNVIAEGRTLEAFTTERWSQPILAGDIVPALVTFVPGSTGGSARVRIGEYDLELKPSAFAWTRRPSAAALFKVGDLIEVNVRALEGRRPSELLLEQPPAVEGALVAIDNRSGQIRAMVGGFTSVSTFIDEPVSYEAGPNQPPYRPLNYDRKYEGPVTLRRALEQSRNIPAVKAMAELGPKEVVTYAKRFGLKGDYQPYLSLALGAAEATLVEMTSAYSAFANQGVRLEPYAVMSIADREGNVLLENRPEPREALRADTAFVMTNLLRGVVQRGTASAANALNWPLAGKTGTMDEYTDAWFIGFDPNITVGVWVGYDEKKPLGNGETGAAAALPIWIDFMKVYLDKYGDRKNPPQFEAPGNIVFVTLDSGVSEAFINGTQPATAATSTPALAPTPTAPVAPTIE